MNIELLGCGGGRGGWLGLAERLSQVLVQGCGKIPTILSQSLPSLDRLCDVSRQLALARCLLKIDHWSAE